MNKIQLALLATVLAGASVTVRAESTTSNTMTDQSGMAAQTATTTEQSATTDQTVALENLTPAETREVATQFIDDSVVTARVVAALIAEPAVSDLNLNIETLDGVVSLSGNAASEAERKRAVQMVSSIDGVCDVRDNIQAGR